MALRPAHRDVTDLETEGRLIVKGPRDVQLAVQQELRLNAELPVIAKLASARAGRAEVLLNLRECDHHHHWIDRTLVKSGTCIEAPRVV